jgi:hypothetical protein
MALINGIILDETTGLPIQGVSIKETISPVMFNTGKILGRDYEIIKTTTPYLLKIKSKSGPFELLKLSALGTNINVESIESKTGKNKEGTIVLEGYTFIFKNESKKVIESNTIKEIILFIDDNSQTQYTNSGLTIEKLPNG